MVSEPRPRSLTVVLLLLPALLLAACGTSSTPATTGTKAATPEARTAAPAPQASATPAPAKAPDIKELALNPTPDREQKLLEAAKTKGAIMLYSGTPTGLLTPTIKAFEKKYGLKVSHWQSTGMEAVPRALSEYQAGRMVMDVVWASDPPLIALSKEKILTPFKSLHHDGFPKDLFVADRVYPTSVNFWMWAYNTDQLKPSELPRTFPDLLDPKWKGKIMIARYTDWFHTLWTAWGEQKARDYFTKLAAQQPLIHDGFSGVTTALVAGERPFTVSMVSGNLVPQMQKGAKVAGYFNDDLIVSRNSSIGWYHAGTNPEGGLLFTEFVLSPRPGEGQTIMRDYGRIPSHNTVEPDPPSLRPAKYIVVNNDAYMPEQEKWDRLFDTIFRAK